MPHLGGTAGDVAKLRFAGVDMGEEKPVGSMMGANLSLEPGREDAAAVVLCQQQAPASVSRTRPVVLVLFLQPPALAAVAASAREWENYPFFHR